MKCQLRMELSNLVCSCSYEPEAFGRVSVEAQSMEIPIVASDIGRIKRNYNRRQNRIFI